MLCCSCFWHQRLIFNNKIYNADVNNNVVNIKVLLSVSSVLLPFLCQTHVGASSYFFFQTKENGSARYLAAIIVEQPLLCSGQIPCQALLTPARVYWFPRVAPARAICLFETPASKGTSKLCQGFRVRLNLKYYLRPATTLFPAQVRECNEKRFCSLQKRSASVLGAGDVTVTRQIVPRFLTTSSCQCLGVYCCVGPVVEGAFATV